MWLIRGEGMKDRLSVGRLGLYCMQETSGSIKNNDRKLAGAENCETAPKVLKEKQSPKSQEIIAERLVKSNMIVLQRNKVEHQHISNYMERKKIHSVLMVIP